MICFEQIRPNSICFGLIIIKILRKLTSTVIWIVSHSLHRYGLRFKSSVKQKKQKTLEAIDTLIYSYSIVSNPIRTV